MKIKPKDKNATSLPKSSPSKSAELRGWPAIAQFLGLRNSTVHRWMRRDFTARKQILWESETATKAEVSKMEREFIEKLFSNDPAVGYNKWPKFKPK